jgi:asparagine synthetase B (glutamine-hydrolysing)
MEAKPMHVLIEEYDARKHIGTGPCGGMGVLFASCEFDSIAMDDARDLVAIWHGEVYLETSDQSSAASRALAAYVSAGEKGLSALDGSFAGLVVDRRRQRIIAVTDATSAKHFYCSDGQAPIRLTTDLADQTLSRLDPGGVCSYLASDGVHGEATPLAGVSFLPPGALHDVSLMGLMSRSYWQMAYRPRSGSFRYEELEEEWVALMRSSVRRRLASLRPSKVYVSLSGGHDSRGLLGFTRELLDGETIEAITYHHGAAVGDMDRDPAKAIAKAAGVRHRTVEGYSGNLIGLLRFNAVRGKSVAHFCDEGDAWASLDDEFRSDPGALLVVGDRQSQHFWFGKPLSGSEALAVCSVKPPSAIAWFLVGLVPEVASEMLDGWGRRHDRIARSLDSSEFWEDRLHRAYLQERIPYTLNLWRELICGASINVTSPYLSRDVLEFALTLPMELNDEDKGMLHSRAIWNTFPALAEVQLSHGGWNIPDWAEELRRHARAIRAMVRDEPSPLDDLIPADAVLSLLDAVESARPTVAKATHGYRWGIRRVVKEAPAMQEAVRRWKRRGRVRDSGVRVDAAHLLRSLLVLRSSLGELSAPNSKESRLRAI